MLGRYEVGMLIAAAPAGLVRRNADDTPACERSLVVGLATRRRWL